MPAGRPTIYSEDIATIILQMMIEGYSLRKITQIDHMPESSTVYRWLHRYPEFRENYGKAQQDRTTVFAEQILEIADENGSEEDQIPEHIQKAKLRIDTRKWLMSKMDPKRWGEKSEVALSGTITTAKAIDDDELAAIAAGSRAGTAGKA